jgi:hypothetical protein
MAFQLNNVATLTESQAVAEYIRYQDSVLTNDRALTFLEWVKTTKLVLKDVPPDELAEVMT